MRWMYRASALVPGSGRLSTLIFHRVLPAPDPLLPGEMHARRFDELCGWMARDFNVLPLATAVRLLREGGLPPRAACITFDDGYADNHDVALPILRRHGLSATFFIAAGFLDGGRMWNDTVIESVRLTRKPSLDLGAAELPGLGAVPTSTPDDRRATIRAVVDAVKYLPAEDRLAAVSAVAQASGADLPANLMMRSGQVSALRAAGMSIGGHTVTHPILAGLPREHALAEIEGGRRQLQDLTQSPVTLFAYPNGRPGRDYDRATVELVRELGFEAAVSTASGAARGGAELFELPRFTPWDLTRWRFSLRMAVNLLRPRHA